MKNNTVQEGFTSYLNNVIPPNAGEVQVKETKNGFYAGAFWVCQIMVSIAVENLSEEAGANIFEGLLQECTQYVESNSEDIT